MGCNVFNIGLGHSLMYFEDNIEDYKELIRFMMLNKECNDTKYEEGMRDIELIIFSMRLLSQV